MRFRDYQVARERMVSTQVIAQGISDARVIAAMRAIPRHLFLDSEVGPQAYTDHAFPIGFSQTMSQPYMVAYLAEQLRLEGGERVLEIGTGSGYQAAVLAALARSVHSIERIPELAARAEGILDALGIRNVSIKVGDGSLGWREKAPFDRILLTAAATEVPMSLFMQLSEGGVLLGPIADGSGRQEIVKLVRRGKDFSTERLKACAFVPLVRKTAKDPAAPLRED